MQVRLIDSMGDDLRVVNAARVSFAKESEWEWEEVFGVDEQGEFSENIPRLSQRDQKLIHYLAREGHWTPFGHCQATFHIKAPIFVARQLGKHQVGMVWNEVSRRYVDDEPDFYVPDVWRKRAENVKQGSSDSAADISSLLMERLQTQLNGAKNAYQSLLNAGVCPELARMVLPQAMMVEWFWTGSLAAWARVCKLRLDPHSQKETQEIAEQISQEMETLFPVSWSALMRPTQHSVS